MPTALTATPTAMAVITVHRMITATITTDMHQPITADTHHPIAMAIGGFTVRPLLTMVDRDIMAVGTEVGVTAGKLRGA